MNVNYWKKNCQNYVVAENLLYMNLLYATVQQYKIFFQRWGSGSGSVGSATFWVSRSWSAKICGWTDPDSRGKISTSLLITKFYKINEWIKFKLELDSKQWFFSFFYFLLSLFSFYMFLFQRRLQKPVVRWGMLRRILY